MKKYPVPYCPDCQAFTSGSCPHHPASYSPEDFYSTYPSGPACLICGWLAQPLALCLPYASQYDGEQICEDCVRRCLDPAIAIAQALQGHQGRVQVMVDG